MRSLPWRKKNDGESAQHRKTQEDTADEITEEEKPETTKGEMSGQGDGSETEDEEDEYLSGDKAIDAMILGYEHDDAYIMVEHDLLEAAKQVTRDIHLAAYRKHVSAPMPDIQDIRRPTTGPPKSRPQVDGMSDSEEDTNGKDLTTLGELLRRRPVTKTFTVTPLKRKERSPAPINRRAGDAKENKPISTNMSSGVSMSREVTKGVEADDEDDTEDDEDLARPFKKVAKTVSTTSPSTLISIKPADTTVKTIAKSSTVKSTSSLDPDWIFSGLWDDDVKPVRKPLVKRKRVSLAAQLEESSLKILGKKKPISLKDQFKFLDS